MTITIDKHLRLELVDMSHCIELYNLAATNRAYLAEWLPWLEAMDSVSFIQQFITGSCQRNKEGYDYAFVIIDQDKIVGRIGLYKLDRFNRLAEVGYWIGAHSQGKGIISRACTAVIQFAFTDLYLNRIEIRCATGNEKSRKIPVALGCRHEGTIREAECIKRGVP